MFRRSLFLSVGAFALLALAGVPGQVRAQHMRGGFANGVHPGFHGGFRPGFHRGVFGPPFGPGPSAPSSLDLGVEPFQFHAGVFDAVLPVHAPLLGVRSVGPSRDFLL